MKPIKISIITVNYNNKQGLLKTINSVAAQTALDFEFIIIDGASSDGSKELLQENSGKFTYWSSEPDLGIYHAMNKGIRIARGEYLLFLNSGDILHDNQVIAKVEEQMQGNYSLYYGDIIYDEIHTQTKRTFPEKLNFSFFYIQNLSHQASFIKKTLFDELFLYTEDFKIVSDWEFFTCAVCKLNVPYKHLDMLITTYDATGISSDTENHTLMNKEREISLNKHFPAFLEDYTYVPELKNKRVRQFLFIKEHRIAWRTLKTIMSLILLFLPKFNKTA